MTQLIQPVNPALEAAFLDCHSDGHQWDHLRSWLDPIDAEPGMRAPWGGTNCAGGRRSICRSCGGERIRWYTRSGEVVNRYQMRDGYYHQREPGVEDPAPSRRDYRQRLITFMEDMAAAEASPPRPIRRARKKAAS